MFPFLNEGWGQREAVAWTVTRPPGLGDPSTDFGAVQLKEGGDFCSNRGRSCDSTPP